MKLVRLFRSGADHPDAQAQDWINAREAEGATLRTVQLSTAALGDFLVESVLVVMEQARPTRQPRTVEERVEALLWRQTRTAHSGKPAPEENGSRRSPRGRHRHG